MWFPGGYLGHGGRPPHYPSPAAEKVPRWWKSLDGSTNFGLCRFSWAEAEPPSPAGPLGRRVVYKNPPSLPPKRDSVRNIDDNDNDDT